MQNENVVVRNFESLCSSLRPTWLKVPHLDLNLGVIQSVQGGFKLAHIVFGLICLAVVSNFCQYRHPLTGSSLGFFCSNSATFFLLVAYSCFVTSVLLMLCYLFSYFTASFLPKTTFEFSFFGFSCLMYFCASTTLVVTVVTSNLDKGNDKEPDYVAKIAVSVLGYINCILYGCSTFYSMRQQDQPG